MKYTSTRDASVSVDSATAVTDGISADGGLFVPVELPVLRYRDMLELDFSGRVDKVLRAFFDFDVSGIAKAACAKFDDDPATITKLDDDLFVLELWHGATCAYGDISFSVLPRLLARAKAARGMTDKTLALVAADGDTCKAALEGFGGADGTEVCAFYPTGGVSAVQELSLRTHSGDNVRAVGVNASADDVRIAVKKAFADVGLRARLAENNITLSTADSCNIGVLVPLIANYFSAYCDLVQAGEIEAGDKIDFVVPTGSFGNALAGMYARRMGVPINKLVCASNENDVITEFIQTGMYDANRELFATESPSMDILVASNVERLVFETSGGNAELTAERMTALETEGRFSVTQGEAEIIREAFAGDHADDDDTEEAVCDMFDEYGYLLDPHTATAYAVCMRRETVRPTVVVSTVNPYKFAPAVLRALGEDAADEATLAVLAQMEDITAMEIPEQLKRLFTAGVRSDDTAEIDGIAEYISTRYCK